MYAYMHTHMYNVRQNTHTVTYLQTSVHTQPSNEPVSTSPLRHHVTETMVFDVLIRAHTGREQAKPSTLHDRTHIIILKTRT
jgi:hypothetical protein